jgi:hypothetical protein
MTLNQLINHLIEHRNYCSYLEIALLADTNNFSKIKCKSKMLIIERLLKNAHESISDKFFAYNKDTFDIILIDGLHTQEQVIKDVKNALLFLNNQGIIILHDCMPPDEWHQRDISFYKEGEAWNGTVWQAALSIFNTSTYKCLLLNMDWGCGIIDTSAVQLAQNKELPSPLDYNSHFQWLLEYKITPTEWIEK